MIDNDISPCKKFEILILLGSYSWPFQICDCGQQPKLNEWANFEWLLNKWQLSTTCGKLESWKNYFG